MAFLDRMAIAFFAVIAVMWIITLIKPREEAYVVPHNTEMALESSGIAKIFGVLVIAATLVLYWIFR